MGDDPSKTMVEAEASGVALAFTPGGKVTGADEAEDADQDRRLGHVMDVQDAAGSEAEAVVDKVAADNPDFESNEETANKNAEVAQDVENTAAQAKDDDDAARCCCCDCGRCVIA